MTGTRRYELDMRILEPSESTPDTTGWKGRHMLALKRGHPIVFMLYALYQYQGEHYLSYRAPLSEDDFLGPAWLEALEGARALLNGDIGGLDGGTLEAAINRIKLQAGFEGVES